MLDDDNFNQSSQILNNLSIGKRGNINEIIESYKQDKISGLKNRLSGVITNTDISNIENFKLAIKNGDTVQTAWNKTMLTSSMAAQNLVIGTNGDIQAIAELTVTQDAAKTSTIGLQMAQMALNAVIGLGIGLAISLAAKGINSLVHYYDNLNDKVSEVMNTYNSSQSTLDSHKTTIDDISDRYVELSKGVDSLGNNVNLTKEEFNEYNDICNQIAEMYPELVQGWTTEGNAILTLKGNVEDLTEAYRQEKIAANDALIKSAKKIVKNSNWDTAKLQTGDDTPAGMEYWEYQKLREYLTTNNLENYIKQNGTIGNLGAIFKQMGIKNTWSNMNQDDMAKEITKVIAENKTTILSYLDTFESEMNEAIADKKSLAEAYLSNQLLNVKKVGQSGTTASQLSDEMQNLVSSVVKNVDFDTAMNWESYEDIQKYVNDIVNEIDNLGEENQASITTFLDIQTKFNNGSVSYGEYQKALTSVQTAISGLSDSTKESISVALNLNDNDFEEQYASLIKKFGDNEGAKKWLKGLTKNELSIAYELSLDTTSATWDLEDWKSKIEGETKIQTALSFDVQGSTDSLKTINDIVQSSMSGAGLTVVKDGQDVIDQVQTIVNAYSSLDDYDASTLFQRTANGIKINLDELRRLREEQETINKQNFADSLVTLNKEYDDLTQQIHNATSAEERNQLITKQNEIAGDIKKVSDLASQYDGLTSAYQAWIDAQSNGESGDMYDKIRDGLDNIKKLYDEGLVGTEEFRSYVDLLSGEDLSTASVDEVVAAYERLNKKIEGTSYTAKDFLKEDSTGVENFLNAINQINSAWASKDVNGNWSLQFDNKAVADSLGVDVEFVESMIQKLKDYGFDIDIDATEKSTKTLKELKLTAKDANEELKKADGLEYNIDINFGSNDPNYINGKIGEVEEKLSSFKRNADGTIDLKQQGADEIQVVLASLYRQKQELEKPWIMQLDVSGVDSDTGSVISLVEVLQGKLEKLQINQKIGADTTEAQAEVQNLVNKIKELDPDGAITKQINFDTTEAQNALDTIANADVKVNGSIDSGSVDTMIATIQGITPQMTVNAGLDDKLVAQYDPNSKYNKQADVKYKVDDSKIKGWEPPDKIGTVWYTVKAKGTTRVKIVSQEASVDGTAHARGTAFAHGSSGNWSVGTDGISLGGELGEEILVRDGNWYSIGANSAEFFEHRKGDIIFNAEQSKQIFKYGKITNGKKRGTTYASGTAFASGTGSFNNGNSNGNNNSTKTDKTKDKKTTDKTDKTLEKFKKWFDKLFDWIEIKLERQADKISKYVKNAENAMKNGNYQTSADNYISAIGSTATQIDNQRQASSKYKSKANSVMKKAVKDGLVSQKMADSIKKKMANGTLDISSYNERVQEVIKSYQTWYDKSQDSKDAISDLHQEIKDYVKDLKEMRDAQRDASISMAETRQSIGTSGVTSSSGSYYGLKNSQLNYTNTQIQKQNDAYQTETDNVGKDLSKIAGKATNSKGTGAIDKALNKGAGKKKGKYRTALKNAQKAIKARKKVASADLKIIKKNSISTYEKIVAYNAQLDSYKDALYEKATAYAINSSEIYKNIADTYKNMDDASNNKINLNEMKANNATTATSANNFLLKSAKEYDTILSNDQAEINKYQKDMQNKQKTIAKSNSEQRGNKYKNLDKKGKENVNKVIDKAQDCVKRGVAIPAATISKLAEYYSKGYVTYSFYKACVDYNNALESKREAEAQKAIDKQTAIEQKAALGSQMISNIEQSYQNKSDANARETQKIETAQKLKTTKGMSLTKSDYQRMINQAAKDKTIYDAEANAIRKQIQKNLDEGLWTTNTQEYKDALNTLAEYENKSAECVITQEELNNAIANIPFEQMEKAVSVLDSFGSYLSSLVDLAEALGNDLDVSHFTNQINNNLGKIEEYNKGATEAYNNWQTALASADGVYGGKTADEWKALYYDNQAQVNSLKVANQELRDSLIDNVYLAAYAKVKEDLEHIEKLVSGISDLIDDNALFDKDGKMTEFGTAKLSLLIEQLDDAKKGVKNYSDEIQELNDRLASGDITQKEFDDRIKDVQENLLSSASSMKSYIDSIIDMYKRQAEAELKVIDELIDKRKESLKAKKEYYDYDKTIKDKTKDIQSLQAQIAALEGVETAEARAKKATLQAELAKAQEDLNDTVNDHLLELSENALDDLSDTLQEAFDDYWDNLWTNLDEVQKILSDAMTASQESQRTTAEALNKLLQFYGISPVDVGYANGSKYINRNQVAWTQEKGSEIIVRKSDGAILTPLNRGDSVIPNALSKNLFSWGEYTPKDFANNYMSKTNIPANLNNMNVVQHYDSLLNVEGNVDSTVITDLQKFVSQFYSGSYQYTIREMTRDARKLGIKP